MTLRLRLEIVGLAIMWVAPMRAVMCAGVLRGEKGIKCVSFQQPLKKPTACQSVGVCGSGGGGGGVVTTHLFRTEPELSSF